MGKLTDLKNIAASLRNLKIKKICDRFCGRVCTHLIQERVLSGLADTDERIAVEAFHTMEEIGFLQCFE